MGDVIGIMLGDGVDVNDDRTVDFIVVVDVVSG